MACLGVAIPVFNWQPDTLSPTDDAIALGQAATKQDSFANGKATR
jgi:hypothetical protein